MKILHENWESEKAIGMKSFVCGYCGSITGGRMGFKTTANNGAKIYFCGGCNQPTFFWDNCQIPSPILGNPVSRLPQEINELYEEARKCTSLEAYTASVLCCRKILMHIAVDRGAPEGLSFLKYVEHLETQHYIPPNGRPWVDHIREKGNEANHEIKVMGKDEAEKLLIFVEMLLKIVYEFPGLLSPATP